MNFTGGGSTGLGFMKGRPHEVVSAAASAPTVASAECTSARCSSVGVRVVVHSNALTDEDGSAGGSAPLVGGLPINSVLDDGPDSTGETPSMGFSPMASYGVLESKSSSSSWEIESRPLTS